MGYTHYHAFDDRGPGEFSPEQWERLMCAADACIFRARLLGICVTRDIDDPAPAEINSDFIRFNGATEETGHETFTLHRTKGAAGTCGWFCKTAQKDYDAVITAVLLAAHNIAPGVLALGSDGRSYADWRPGIELLGWDNIQLPAFLQPGFVEEK